MKTYRREINGYVFEADREFSDADYHDLLAATANWNPAMIGPATWEIGDIRYVGKIQG